MKITTAWTDNGDAGDLPELLSAYDETQFDAWNGVPDWHQKAIDDHLVRNDGPVRELVVEIPDEAVAALFRAPTVKGTVR